jgi:large subunit ribosomal protein L35
MPKLKVHRGTSKRVKTTSTGKLVRRRAYASHLLSKKSGARKREFTKNQSVQGSDSQSIRRNLGI